jgi:hypothetical protein
VNSGARPCSRNLNQSWKGKLRLQRQVNTSARWSHTRCSQGTGLRYGRHNQAVVRERKRRWTTIEPSLINNSWSGYTSATKKKRKKCGMSHIKKQSSTRMRTVQHINDCIHRSRMSSRLGRAANPLAVSLKGSWKTFFKPDESADRLEPLQTAACSSSAVGLVAHIPQF